MPRRARLYLPGIPLHIIQRGNNRQACFFADEDYRFYLDWLSEYAAKAHQTNNNGIGSDPHGTKLSPG